MTLHSPELSGTAVATLIGEHKQLIIRRWQQRTLREVYAASEQDQPSLIDSLSEFLDQMSLTVMAPQDAEQEERTGRVARGHGEERAQSPGYTLDQVISEYQLLREVLVETLTQSASIAPESLRRIHVVMDQAIREASVHFVERSQEILRRAKCSTQFLEHLVEQIFASFTGAMAYLTGPDFVYERVNTGYRHLFHDRDLVGKPVLEALPELATTNFPSVLQKLFAKGGTAFISEEQVDFVDRKTGRLTTRYFDGSYSRTEDAEGRPHGIFSFATEVTERVAARQEALRIAQALHVSERRLADALAVIGAGTWEVDLSTQEVLADRRFREMFGMSLEEPFTRAKGLDIIHPEDRQAFAAAISRAIAGDNRGLFEADYRTVPRKDGSYQWVVARGRAYFDDQGKALRFVGTSVDITARKKVEALLARQVTQQALNAQVGLALLRSASLHEMLQRCVQALVDQLEAAAARVWLYAPAQDMLELYASAGLDTPLEARDGGGPKGQTTMDLIAKERRPYLSNSVMDDPRMSAPEWARREGLKSFAGYPLLVGDKLVGVVALFSREALEPDTFDMIRLVADTITLGVERLKAEGELKTRVDFEQKLIGIVSHDLRNPLSAILMGASMLAKREDLDARDTKALVRIQSAAERAARMVKDLLDFTQARLGGGLRINRQPMDMHRMARGVLEEVEAAWPGREVQARYDGDGQGNWDADRLAQVVQNLITNALKYSPPGSPVHVTLRGGTEDVSLCVANEGPPIPADKLANIFEPMQRASAELDEAGRSVGLGLYIIERIVAAHGGSIGVVSTQEEGTRFTVHLPRQGRATP